MEVHVFGWWIALSVALAGSSPELPRVLEETRPLRALRMAEGAPPVTEAQYAEVAAGKVVTRLVGVDGEAAKKSYGVAVLDQPIERVWAAVNDESLHPHYTDLTYVELVEGEACSSGRHVLQYLPVGVPMVKDRWWVTIRTHNERLAAESGGRMRELVYRNAPDGSGVRSAEGRAKLEEGVMIGFTRGAWFLTAIDEGRTLVEYYSWVDPGGNLSPTLMNWFAGKAIRGTLESMERLAADPRVGCLP